MNRLKALRKKKGLTQLNVQMATQIDQSDYSKIETEKRRPSLQQAQLLSKLFGTSVEYIFGYTDDPSPVTASEDIGGDFLK